jgi:oligopeptide transport system substrate-binding protein
LSEIHFVRIDSADGEDRAYRAGQVDATMAVPVSKVDAYAQERPGELHRTAMIETRYFSFNTKRRPLDDERVRRALALAIDRQKIVERVVKGGQQPATRFVPPALRIVAGNASALAGEHRYDPDTARRLLAEAGVDAKKFPKLEITAWSSSQSPVLEAAQQMWRQELGLDFAIAIREARVHWNALKVGDYDIAFVTAVPDVADIAQLLGDFVSDASENYPQWRDRTFDEAFTHASLATDVTTGAAGFLAAEQRLLESAPLTPAYFNTKVWLMSPRVRGWQEDGLWTRCYQNVSLDEK